MRPVERGPRPTDKAGTAVVIEKYNHARPHLIDRLGEYCSFCEMQLGSGLAVEHIRHKDGNPDLECQWSNFLLACPSCNSTKGTKIDTQADVDQRLWPHSDRTFDAFVYLTDGVVRLAEIADPVVRAKAEALEEMVGLCKRPGAGLTPEQLLRDSDRRWRKRRQAWQAAEDARDDLRAHDTSAMRQRILAQARETGFWSVWMTVFADDPAMTRALCERDTFKGTAAARVFRSPSFALPVPLTESLADDE